jgi:hypothetical protein
MVRRRACDKQESGLTLCLSVLSLVDHGAVVLVRYLTGTRDYVRIISESHVLVDSYPRPRKLSAIVLVNVAMSGGCVHH